MPSTISGVGVFAIKDIEEGENPFNDEDPTKWVKLKLSELEQTNEEVKKLIKDFFVEEGKNIWVNKNGFYSLGMSFYVNHSKTPNLKSIDTKNGTIFIAKRKILKGEELFADYSEYEEKKYEYLK
jgi:hypothetical protein